MEGPISHDMDDPVMLQSLTGQLTSPLTHNFVVECNTVQTLCGINVTVDGLEKLLTSSQRPSITRWINFFGWNPKQKKAVSTIAEHYGLSPRLQDLLWPDQISANFTDGLAMSTPTPTGALRTIAPSDVEAAVKPEEETSEATRDHASPLPRFLDIIRSLWHFCAVESGEHFLYIGYNALYTVNSSSSSSMETIDPNKPSGQRIWTSLLLCDDGTVVSVFENPSSLKDSTSFDDQQQVLKIVRQNAINVFRNLSRLYESSGTDQPLGKVSIRSQTQDAPGVSRATTARESFQPQISATQNESSALLFYYLFDDWIAAYSRLTRSEYSHRVQLEKIRRSMLKFADVELVERLHVLGRQLAVLKNVYRSYELIVKRILYRHQRLHQRVYGSRGLVSNSGVSMHHPPSMANVMGTVAENGEDDEDGFAHAAIASMLDTPLNPEDRICLPSSTIFRFERLLDRIQLLTQTEIEECIAEKNSLTFMNFNLIALAESQAVETLTRTTVLLAKATILFLPVSLMTGYFSITLPEVQTIYSLKTYWLCFLVIALLTISILLMSGFAREKVKGRMGYKGLTRMIWDVGRRRERQRGRDRGKDFMER